MKIVKSKKLKVSKATKRKYSRNGKVCRCNKCDCEGINEITLKKHTNTKHMKEHYRCNK